MPWQCYHLATPARFSQEAAIAVKAPPKLNVISSDSHVVEPPDTIEMCLEAAWTIGTLIFSGVFLRYPKLKLISAENDAGWMAYYLWRSDFSKGGNLKRITRGRGHALTDQPLLPSEIFRRNVYMSFQRDRSAVQMRELIGADNLMWGADYPHLEGTWPISKQTFDWLFAGVPEADKRKMTRDNCAKLYGWER